VTVLQDAFRKLPPRPDHLSMYQNRARVWEERSDIYFARAIICGVLGVSCLVASLILRVIEAAS
jgi:hypothetical protein